MGEGESRDMIGSDHAPASMIASITLFITLNRGIASTEQNMYMHSYIHVCVYTHIYINLCDGRGKRGVMIINVANLRHYVKA